MRVLKSMRLWLLIGLTAVALPIAAGATTLGVQGNLANILIDFDLGGTYDYNPVTGSFMMTGSVVPPSVGLDMSEWFTLTPATVTLQITVDATGALLNGVNGLTVLSQDGVTQLLTADVTAFGWEDGGGVGGFDKFDFFLGNLGGSEAGDFTGLAGMFSDVPEGTLTMPNSTFAGDFTSNFGGTSLKGGIGNLVPEPNAALMAAIALTFVGLRSRRRR